jgi:metallophosphoesterase (TIGR00282 family)
MKILYVAELVGKAGIYCFKKAIGSLKQELSPDFVIVCADGATGGNGLGFNHAGYLKKLGADAITLGECCFYKKDLTENLNDFSYVLRPVNLGGEPPGRGEHIFKVGQTKIALVVLLGQSSFTRIHSENPVAGLSTLLERLHEKTPFVIIDYHAQASAEKQTLFFAAQGQCTAIIGSHCRVQTADETVLAGGTAVITDAGRTGSQCSVGGSEIQSKIFEFMSGIPEWTKDAWDCCELQGVFIETDDAGKALTIKRIRREINSDSQISKP